MVSVSQFVSEYNGKFVKSPHGILGQCVSVPSEFAILNANPELYGAGDGTALQIWNNGVGGYQKIKNVPANQPAPGDFIFFDNTYGNGAGHTGVVVTANLESLVLFEQNDPTGSAAHEETYNYSHVLGWFHWPPAPQAGTAEAIRTTSVRVAPNTTAALAGSKTLTEGETFQFKAIVNGQQVTENGVTTALWYESSLGHYVWSGNCKLV